MAGVNIGDVGLTFTRYLQGVVETLNQKSKLRQLVRRDDKWTGSNIEGRVHTARNSGIGYVEDGGAFPVPDKQDYQTYKAYRKFLVGSVQLTDGVMATAAKGKNVARDVITSEIKGMMTGLMKYENGMMYKDGTGAVTTLYDNTLASSVTDVTVYDARMLWDGVKFEIRDSAAIGTLHGSSTVSNVEQATSSNLAVVNFASGETVSGVAAGDYVVWPGAVNRAITGLDKLVGDSGTFQNINTATYPRYTSFVMDNSGSNRDLTPSLFRQLLAGIMHKSGSDKPDDGLTVMTNAWQAINVEELYEGELRLSPSDKTGGFAVTSFQSALGRIDIIVDTDAPYNKIFAVDLSKVYRAVQKDLAWRRQGGSIFKRSDTSGVWTATAMEICELYIKERNTSGKIADLNQTTVNAY